MTQIDTVREATVMLTDAAAILSAAKNLFGAMPDVSTAAARHGVRPVILSEAKNLSERRPDISPVAARRRVRPVILSEAKNLSERRPGASQPTPGISPSVPFCDICG